MRTSIFSVLEFDFKRLNSSCIPNQFLLISYSAIHEKAHSVDRFLELIIFKHPICVTQENYFTFLSLSFFLYKMKTLMLPTS
jgi:hypothetical protein